MTELLQIANLLGVEPITLKTLISFTVGATIGVKLIIFILVVRLINSICNYLNRKED